MLPVLMPLPDPALNGLVRRSVETAIAAVAPKAQADDVGVAVGVVDRKAGTVRWGGLNETKTHYPASTIKLFWLAYAENRIAEGKLKPTPELQRGLNDMIVDSTNDATALIVDASTDTTGGAELAPAQFAKWLAKREAANRWFSGMGYTGVNVLQKTWNEGPYGRERQALGKDYEARNAMSPFAGMRLLSEIMLDRIVDPAACGRMRTLLNRREHAGGQVEGFIGGVVKDDCGLWSKAGWTSAVRCDLAWIKAPDGREVVLSIFIDKSALVEPLLPRVAREVLLGLEMPVR